MRIELEADGHKIVVDAEGELASVASVALELWQGTAPEVPARPGPAFGVQTQLAPTPAGHRGWLNRGEPTPVRAEA